MMHRRLRHATAAIGAAAVLAVAGCGTADQASTTAASGTAAAAQTGGPGGTLSAASLKTLAAKLGVSATRLKAAMEKSRPDTTSGQPPTGNPTAALAKELDLSTAKVQAAMKAAGMGRGGAPPNGSAPSQSSTQS
jgi:hypothetical protein